MTNKYLAFPIFLVVMGLMFAVTFGAPGTFLTGLTESLVGWIGDWAARGLEAVAAPEWVTSLVGDGVIAGVGGVLVFLPQILLIFLFMSVLEDSGYMARAAFITDRLLRKFGLSGRSFHPDADGLRLHDHGDHRRARRGERARPADDDSADAVHELWRAAAGLRTVHGGVFPEQPGAGGAEPVRAGDADDDRVRAGAAQDGVSRGRFPVPDGAAALPRAARAQRAQAAVGPARRTS